MACLIQTSGSNIPPYPAVSLYCIKQHTYHLIIIRHGTQTGLSTYVFAKLHPGDTT